MDKEEQSAEMQINMHEVGALFDFQKIAVDVFACLVGVSAPLPLPDNCYVFDCPMRAI